MYSRWKSLYKFVPLVPLSHCPNRKWYFCLSYYISIYYLFYYIYFSLYGTLGQWDKWDKWDIFVKTFTLFPSFPCHLLEVRINDLSCHYSYMIFKNREGALSYPTCRRCIVVRNSFTKLSQLSQLSQLSHCLKWNWLFCLSYYISIYYLFYYNYYSFYETLRH